MDAIPVFFSTKMCASIQSTSPSAGKPALVVESWKKLGIPLEFHEPDPVSIDELKAVHNPDFVDGVLSCRLENGFENKSPEVAASLPYTSGAMLSAARYLLKARDYKRTISGFGDKLVAAAPCSGFHHAEYGEAMGFCTFNGLMVAAMALKKEGLAKKVGILDFDQHYGNGTDNIIEKLDVEWVSHYTAGAYYQHAFQAPSFFLSLPLILDKMDGCDIVLYQAGADPHIDDPHGGWLTTDELRRRDSIVFDILKQKGIPVAWNLAGGYQVEPDGSIPRVLEIHDNTMKECAGRYL